MREVTLEARLGLLFTACTTRTPFLKMAPTDYLNEFVCKLVGVYACVSVCRGGGKQNGKSG